MKKRRFALVLAVLLVLSLAACGQKEGAGKTFTLTVVHRNGSSRELTVTTDKDTVGEALESEGIISGEMGAYGLFMKTVDGETVDESNQEWWCLTKGGQQVNTGVDLTPVAEGDSFELTLTVGY